MDFCINTTKRHNSFNYSNTTVPVSEDKAAPLNVLYVPLNLLAIYAVYSVIRKDHFAQIYVINLLISDLIQLCCMITEVVTYKEFFEIFAYMHLIGLMASVCFMVCIALERYLVMLLYVFLRKGALDKLLVSLCCWTKDSDGISRITLSAV